MRWTLECCRVTHWDAFAAGTASRWRWTVLIVGATLLLCLTVLVSYLTRNFVKREFAIIFAAALQEGTDETFWKEHGVYFFQSGE